MIDELLDVERTRRKPQYSMAPEIPLVLRSCEFDGLSFKCSSGTLLLNHCTLLSHCSFFFMISFLWLIHQFLSFSSCARIILMIRDIFYLILPHISWQSVAKSDTMLTFLYSPLLALCAISHSCLYLESVTADTWSLVSFC